VTSCREDVDREEILAAFEEVREQLEERKEEAA
jgi:hypothetical protein